MFIICSQVIITWSPFEMLIRKYNFILYFIVFFLHCTHYVNVISEGLIKHKIYSKADSQLHILKIASFTLLSDFLWHINCAKTNNAFKTACSKWHSWGNYRKFISFGANMNIYDCLYGFGYFMYLRLSVICYKLFLFDRNIRAIKSAIRYH